MLLPYNVDRPTRALPVVTYALMAANIFFFLLSVLIANLSLSADHQAAQQAIQELLRNDPEASQIVGALSEFPDRFSDVSPQKIARWEQQRALELAAQKLETPAQYQTFWQIEHADSSWVMEPHYSVLNAFAFRVNDASPLHQIVTIFSAMFLHADIEHIAGNLLFLWVFGRATEEFLGWKIYLSIYFCAGVAATLLDQMMSLLFAPNSLGLPNLGASGAIAGVLGLFAVRFFRTRVRIFYLTPWAGVIAAIAVSVVSFLLYLTLRDATAATVLSLIGVLGALFIFGREWLWGAFRAPSAWVIGGWVVIMNLAPALWKMMTQAGGGGVAYWAHIGGFGLGALYAVAIGGAEEGKTEYAIEDAGTALQQSGAADALERATQILQREPHNVRAHEIAARAYDGRLNRGSAAQTEESYRQAEAHYQQALEGLWRAGEREDALNLYAHALERHPQLPLRPALLLNFASALMQSARPNPAGALLTRLTDEFDGTPEAEVALLRSAQLWMRQFGEPAQAARQLELFLRKYPDSHFRAQAQQALAQALAAQKTV